LGGVSGTLGFGAGGTGGGGGRRGDGGGPPNWGVAGRGRGKVAVIGPKRPIFFFGGRGTGLGKAENQTAEGGRGTPASPDGKLRKGRENNHKDWGGGGGQFSGPRAPPPGDKGRAAADFFSKKRRGEGPPTKNPGLVVGCLGGVGVLEKGFFFPWFREQPPNPCRDPAQTG